MTKGRQPQYENKKNHATVTGTTPSAFLDIITCRVQSISIYYLVLAYHEDWQEVWEVGLSSAVESVSAAVDHSEPSALSCFFHHQSAKQT